MAFISVNLHEVTSIATKHTESLTLTETLRNSF